MKTVTRTTSLAFAAVLMAGALCRTAGAQTLLDESGTSILAPVIAPTGGYSVNPQEYLPVAWTVSENASDVYTYSYTVSNPNGDVLMTDSGGLTTTPEIFDTFSVGFLTTVPGAYVSGSQMGSPNELVSSINLTWFFDPSITNNSSAPTVSFESLLPPVPGGADAQDAVPPSPWSQDVLLGPPIPVPGPATVPNAMSTAALVFPVLLLFAFRSGAFANQPRTNART